MALAGPWGGVKFYSCHAWLPKTDEPSEMQLFNSECPVLVNVESLDQAPGPGPVQNTSPISRRLPASEVVAARTERL